VAKSKSRTSSSASAEKRSNNALVQQFYAVRSEVRKVTWPTREEARQLTIAVTVGTVVIAIFLFLVDLLFEGVIAGIIGENIVWVIIGALAIGLVAAAFYANSRDV